MRSREGAALDLLWDGLEAVLETECSKMTLSIDGHSGDVSRAVTSVGRFAGQTGCKCKQGEENG